MIIALRVNRLQYDIEYVDLKNLPQWLVEVAPLQRVPVLIANDQVLYESHVILDFLNDVGHGSLHPEDPLDRARQRSLMEFGSEILETQWLWSTTSKSETYESTMKQMLDQLKYIELQLHSGPFFNGEKLSMIDISFAPLLQRLIFNERDHQLNIFEELPKLKAWGQALIELPDVRLSAAVDIDKQIEDDMRQENSILAGLKAA